MRELIDLFGILSEEDIFEEYALNKGLYLKIKKDKPISEEDYILIKDTKTVNKEDELYKWFLQRKFYEGMSPARNSEAVGSKLKLNIKGKKLSAKSVISVTPYCFIIGTKDKEKCFLDREFMGIFFSKYFKELRDVYDESGLHFNEEEMAVLYTEKFNEVLDFLGEEEFLKTGQINLFVDNENVLDMQKAFYSEYNRKKCFHGDYRKEFNGEIYGFSTIFNAYSKDDKPNLVFSSNLRECPYLLSEKEALNLMRISKVEDKFIEKAFLKHYDINLKFESDRTSNNILELKVYQENKKLYPYFRFSIISDGISLSSHGNRGTFYAINIIDENFTNGLFKEALTVSKSDSNKVKSLLSKNLDETNINKQILSNIITRQDSLRRFFIEGMDGQYAIKDIEPILKEIFDKALCEKDLLSKETIEDYYKQRRMFERLLSILYYVEDDKGKEEYRDMIININDIQGKLKSFLNGEIEDYTVDSLEEFLFVSGQVLYYLASQSKAEKKNKLLSPFLSIRNINHLKEAINSNFCCYGYDLSLYGKINTVIQSLFLFKIGEKIAVKDKNLWFYCRAGLIGNNQFYSKKEKEDKMLDEVVANSSTDEN